MLSAKRRFFGIFISHMPPSVLFTLQVLARVLVKALELPDDGTGTAFYRFPEIPSAKVFKDEYRRLLDETKVDPSTCDLIVAEVSAHVRVLISARAKRSASALCVGGRGGAAASCAHATSAHAATRTPQYVRASLPAICFDLFDHHSQVPHAIHHCRPISRL